MKEGHNASNITNDDYIHENGEVTSSLYILYNIWESLLLLFFCMTENISYIRGYVFQEVFHNNVSLFSNMYIL